MASCVRALNQSPRQTSSTHIAASDLQRNAAARHLNLESKGRPQGPPDESAELLRTRRMTRATVAQGEGLDVVEQDGPRGSGLYVERPSALRSPHAVLQRLATSILEVSPKVFWGTLPAEWRHKVTPSELWRVVTHPDVWTVWRELADGVHLLSAQTISAHTDDHVIFVGRFEVHMLRRAEGWIIRDIQPQSAFIVPSSRD